MEEKKRERTKMSKTTLESEDDKILTWEEYLQSLRLMHEKKGSREPSPEFKARVDRMYRGIEMWNPLEK